VQRAAGPQNVEAGPERSAEREDFCDQWFSQKAQQAHQIGVGKTFNAPKFGQSCVRWLGRRVPTGGGQV
jgi:hypothetical protein